MHLWQVMALVGFLIVYFFVLLGARLAGRHLYRRKKEASRNGRQPPHTGEDRG